MQRRWRRTTTVRGQCPHLERTDADSCSDSFCEMRGGVLAAKHSSIFLLKCQYCRRRVPNSIPLGDSSALKNLFQFESAIKIIPNNIDTKQKSFLTNKRKSANHCDIQSTDNLISERKAIEIANSSLQ